MTFFTKHKLKFASLVALLLTLAFASCNVFYFGSDDDDDTTKATSYTVMITGGANATASGDTVKLTATQNDGYELGSYSVTDASGNAVTVTDNTFTIPASNVTVSAVFTEQTRYSITTWREEEFGTVTVSPTSATAGTEITVSIAVTDDNACFFWGGGGAVHDGISGIILQDCDIEYDDDTGGTFTFTMPAKDVVMDVQF